MDHRGDRACDRTILRRLSLLSRFLSNRTASCLFLDQFEINQRSEVFPKTNSVILDSHSLEDGIKFENGSELPADISIFAIGQGELIRSISAKTS